MRIGRLFRKRICVTISGCNQPLVLRQEYSATNKLFEYGAGKNVASMMPGFQVRDFLPELPAHLVDSGGIRQAGTLSPGERDGVRASFFLSNQGRSSR